MRCRTRGGRVLPKDCTECACRPGGTGGPSRRTEQSVFGWAYAVCEGCEDAERMRVSKTKDARGIAWGCAVLFVAAIGLASAGEYEIFATNEKAGTLTVIDGARREAVATIEVGKRPRGLRVSPDGKLLY